MLKRIAAVSLFFIIFSITALAVSAQGTTTYINDAILPTGQSVTIPANAAQWFHFDTGGQKKEVLATLDAPSADGLRLAIYTPDEIAAWQRGDGLKAIGLGGPSQTHTLAWDGILSQPGTNYAVVYNDTGAPVNVAVSVTGDSVTTVVAPTPTRQVDPLVTPPPQGKALNGKIAFVDSEGGNIYTVNGDGTNLKQLTTGLDPQWNHAGTQIAFARQGPTPGIYVINADGTGERLLHQTNEARAPDWSPDDSQIVFTFQGTTKGGKQKCFSFRGHHFCFTTPEDLQWNLGIVNVADSTFHDVRTSNYAFTPTWNADGITIAYSDPSIGLMTTSPNGPESENPFIGDLRITSPAYNPLRIMSPVYSPDGKQIIYMVQQQPTWQIAKGNSDGSDTGLLTSDFALWFNHPSNTAPAWSPDGSQILFLSDRNGKWEYFTMNPDGSNVQQVLKNITDQISVRYDFQSGRMVSWAK